ncbi:MAG: serine--tRNA ligase, partial [Pelolinea sp.]|nr:serine--tRNA ligase [Pelolinea sp.]
MIDIKIIRENPDALREGLKRRQMDTSIVETLTQLDELRRKLLTDAEKLKAERNKVSKEISATKEKTEREAKIDAMREVGRKIDELNE